MFRNFSRELSRSQRWQTASKQQDEPLLDRVMNGDPTACSILGGLLLLGAFLVVCKLLK